MDDSKLRALLTAVQCGSFGKAAAQLGYTQSAMTHLANKLEAELGCTLLTRSSHGVCLSEEGEHLLPYINQVISACDALRSEAEAQGELYGRKLCIGCFASIARSRLPELLRKFRKLHPEIKVCWCRPTSWRWHWRKDAYSWHWWTSCAPRDFIGCR